MKKILLSLVAAAALCVPATAQNSVKNISTSQKTLDCAQLLNTQQPAQLSRILMAGYNTLCLPMSLTADQVQQAVEGARLERLAAIGQDGSTLCLYFLDCTQDGIEAGVPYLIFSPKTQFIRLRNTEALRLSDQLQTVRLSDNMGNTVSFNSSWQTIQQEGRYGIPALQDTEVLESILIRTQADKAFLPTRCGVNWEEQALGTTDIVIRHIQSLDEATGITSLAASEHAGNLYDLAGRKVSNTRKGIVIRDGKKVVK